MFCLWALAALACVLCLAAEPTRTASAGLGDQVLDLVRLLATTALAITLVLGPGALWRVLTERELPLAFMPLPGIALLAATGGIAWVLAPGVDPRLTSFAVFAPVLGLLLGALVSLGDEDVFAPEERRTLLIIGGALGFAISRAIWLPGPPGELYGGAVDRTLEVGDRPDSRISFHTVQLIAHGNHPFGARGVYYFSPYNFSSRGPISGFASAPLVFLSGGRPPVRFPEEAWRPFDAEGFMSYRLAMMTFASTAFLGVWELARRVAGAAAARLALILAVTTPFLVHEVWFTWPKMMAAYCVLLAGVCVLTRRPLWSGLLMGIAYLVHPGALIGLAAIVPLAIWPLQADRKMPEWRRPQIKALVLVLAGTAVGLLLWRVANGHDYNQSGFLEYFKTAGSNFHPSAWEWFRYRVASLGNTVVPLLLPLRFAHNASINSIYEPSPAVIHFFFQYWDGIPFGGAIVFFPLLLWSLWKALRRWPWAVATTVLFPLIGFTIYWGSSLSGMLREGLQAWVAVLFVVIAAQQASERFRWLGSQLIRAILSLRVLELLLVALGPTLFTTHVLIGRSFAFTDTVALAGMLASGAFLAWTVWSTTPESLASAPRLQGDASAEPGPAGAPRRPARRSRRPRSTGASVPLRSPARNPPDAERENPDAC